MKKFPNLRYMVLSSNNFTESHFIQLLSPQSIVWVFVGIWLIVNVFSATLNAIFIFPAKLRLT